MFLAVYFFWLIVSLTAEILHSSCYSYSHLTKRPMGWMGCWAHPCHPMDYIELFQRPCVLATCIVLLRLLSPNALVSHFESQKTLDDSWTLYGGRGIHIYSYTCQSATWLNCTMWSAVHGNEIKEILLVLQGCRLRSKVKLIIKLKCRPNCKLFNLVVEQQTRQQTAIKLCILDIRAAKAHWSTLFYLLV